MPYNIAHARAPQYTPEASTVSHKFAAVCGCRRTVFIIKDEPTILEDMFTGTLLPFPHNSTILLGELSHIAKMGGIGWRGLGSTRDVGMRSIRTRDWQMLRRVGTFTNINQF